MQDFHHKNDNFYNASTDFGFINSFNLHEHPDLNKWRVIIVLRMNIGNSCCRYLGNTVEMSGIRQTARMTSPMDRFRSLFEITLQPLQPQSFLSKSLFRSI